MDIVILTNINTDIVVDTDAMGITDITAAPMVTGIETLIIVTGKPMNLLGVKYDFICIDDVEACDET